MSGFDTAVDWLYLVASNSDGSPRLIVRRNLSGDSWGPLIELLTRDQGWIERPELLTRFHDPGYLESVAPEEARAAAEAIGVPWPGTPDLTPAQLREVQRLVVQGLSEEEARRLATERQLDVVLGLDGKPLHTFWGADGRDRSGSHASPRESEVTKPG